AAPHHYGVRTLERDAGLVEQTEHPERRAGTQAGLAGEEPPLIHGMQPVDVLLGRERFDDRPGLERRRERKLDQDAVHVAPAAELAHQGEQLRLPRARREPVTEGAHAHLLARPLLVADVETRGGIVTDQYGGETRHHPVARETR